MKKKIEEFLTSGAGTAYPSGAPEFTPVFSVFRVARSFVLCVCFVGHWLSFCTFSFGRLCYLFFDIQILITPLVSSNSSFIQTHFCICPMTGSRFQSVSVAVYVV